jgi:hypothetical protein
MASDPAVTAIVTIYSPNTTFGSAALNRDGFFLPPISTDFTDFKAQSVEIGETLAPYASAVSVADSLWSGETPRFTVELPNIWR